MTTRVGGSGWPEGRVRSRCAGFTLAELAVVLASSLVLAAMAVPLVGGGRDHLLASAAAKHLVSQLHHARADAVLRGAYVAIRFDGSPVDVRYALVADGNQNGVRVVDINKGIDRQIGSWERLSDHFQGVQFSIGTGVLDVDSGGPLTGDPLRIGGSDVLSFSPGGTSTSGTLYLKGRSGPQYAIRILGATGRVRLLRFESASRRWVAA